MKVSKCVDLELFNAINETFSNYAFMLNKEKYPCLNLFDNVKIAFISYIHDFGSLKASDLLEEYHTGVLTAEDVSNILQLRYFRNWLGFYELNIAEYNPLWNKEGTEERVITNKQLEDGYQNITHGKVQTSEQLENSVTTSKEFGYNSTTPEDVGETELNGGKTELKDSGTTNTSISSGITETTEKYTFGGNLGVTKTTELFKDQAELLSSWNFLNAIFTDINKDFSYLIWEV